MNTKKQDFVKTSFPYVILLVIILAALFLYNNASYNTYDKYREALRLPLSGYFYNGSANFQGSRGSWWSSTRLDSILMYSLYANTSNINPANLSDRYRGFSVRCVLGS